MAIWLTSIMLAAIVGFAAHRASICTVRAVAEIMSTGRAYCLASFGKSVLWVLAVAVTFLWIDPAIASGLNGWELSRQTLMGGLLFGAGAALMGALGGGLVVYQTMQRQAAANVTANSTQPPAVVQPLPTSNPVQTSTGEKLQISTIEIETAITPPLLLRRSF